MVIGLRCEDVINTIAFCLAGVKATVHDFCPSGKESVLRIQPKTSFITTP